MRLLAPNFLSEFDRMFEGFDRTMPHRSFTQEARMPSAEVAETPEQFLLSVDLPGLKKEDIKIEIDRDVLTISGERKRDFVGEDKALRRIERYYGAFKRSFKLPSTVATENIEARYEDGVLELRLPKTAEAKPRQIEIQTEKAGLWSKILGKEKDPSSSHEVN